MTMSSDLKANKIEFPGNADKSVLALEHEISELIRNGRSGCHASFRYSRQGSKVRAKLLTWNPKHKSTFLVKEIETDSVIQALKQLLKYVKDKIRDDEKPYTVKWHLKDSDDPKLITSHFYATEIYDLLQKFYYDKNHDDYQIIEIKLNPPN